MRPRPRKLQPGLTFQHFLLQSQFLAAYRKAIRSTRPLPDPHTRRETLDYMRADIERLRSVTDLDALKSSLSTFQRNIKTFVPSLGLTGLTPEQGARLVGRNGNRAR